MEETLSEIESTDELGSVELPTSIGLIGISFKTSPIEMREELAKSITYESIGELVHNDPSLAGSEIVLISTCNRIEIYYYGDEALIAKSLKKLFDVNDSNSAEIYHFTGDQAATHLFNVATGLDSLVIGEAQIFSQVKKASRVSSDLGLSNSVMSRLFSKALKAARKVREQNPTFANGINNSVSHAVLELVSNRYRDKKPNLLLIGSGKMIRLAIRSIIKSDLDRVVVAARRKEIDGIKADSIIGIADIARTIVERGIDVVITATASQDYILNAKDLMNNRNPLLILDISVPRNVDPNVGKLQNVSLLNLDDLKDIIKNPTDYALTPKVRKELSREVAEFSSWLADYEEIAPLLSSLRKKAETIREEEVGNALNRMPSLTDNQKAIIEKMSERLIKRFLHDPTLRLKHLSRVEGNQKAKVYAEAISELFTPESSKTRKRESIG
ncbi:MAG: glutamyl-tRNA reductase [Nitrososphaerales archaeon]